MTQRWKNVVKKFNFFHHGDRYILQILLYLFWLLFQMVDFAYSVMFFLSIII